MKLRQMWVFWNDKQKKRKKWQIFTIFFFFFCQNIIISFQLRVDSIFNFDLFQLFSKTTRKNIARVLTVINQSRKLALRKKVTCRQKKKPKSFLSFFYFCFVKLNYFNDSLFIIVVRQLQIETVGYPWEKNSVIKTFFWFFFFKKNYNFNLFIFGCKCLANNVVNWLLPKRTLKLNVNKRKRRIFHHHANMPWKIKKSFQFLCEIYRKDNLFFVIVLILRIIIIIIIREWSRGFYSIQFILFTKFECRSTTTTTTTMQEVAARRKIERSSSAR